MDGTLIRYGPKAPFVAFVSPAVASTAKQGQNRALVAVGGLSCGLLFAEYLAPLQTELARAGTFLCQPLLSSSHDSWGMGSVSRDSEELDLLLEHLHMAYGFADFVLLGHSTGCQDAVMYMRTYGALRDRGFRVTKVVLQGPVSDREYLRWSMGPTIEDKIALCERMDGQGRGDEIAFMFRWEEGGDGVPMTSRRFLSLASVGGEDDMFSSTQLDLEEALSSLRGVPTLVLMSGADECQCGYVEPAAIGRRLVDAIGDSAEMEVIEGGLHDLKGARTSARAALVITAFTNR